MELKSSNIDLKLELFKYSSLRLIAGLFFLVFVGILTRQYTTAEVGLFFFMTAMSYLFTQLAAGYSKAIQKRMSENNGKYTSYYVVLVGFLLAITLGLGAIAVILQLTVIPFNIGEIVVTTTVVWAILLGSLGLGSGVSARNYFSGITRFALGEIYYIGFNVLGGIVLVVLLLRYTDPSIIQLFITFRLLGLITFAFAGIHGYLESEYVQLRPTREQIHDINSFAKWSIPTDILNDFYHRIDTILLAFFLTATIVSFYESSVRITTLAFVLPAGIKQVLTVKVSGYNEEKADYTSIVRQTVLLTIGVMSVLLVVVVAFGEEILLFAFGPAYTETAAVLIFTALMGQMVVQAIRMTYESVFNGLDMPDFNLKVTAATVFINLLFAPWFILTFGGVGMVLSTIVAESSRTGVFYYFYRKKAADDGYL